MSDVANAATARANLGLGNSATRAVGTAANTVAAGNDSRIVAAVQQAAPVMAAPPVITTAQVDQNGVANAAYISGIDLTGSSDASTHLQVALDAIANRFVSPGAGGQLLLPAGSKFRVNGALSFTSDCPISIRSEGGRRGAELRQYGSVLFSLSTSNPSGSNMAVDIDGLRIVCEVNSAKAFSIVNPESVRLSRIRAASGAGHWGVFFEGANIRTSYFEDWYVRNDHGLGTAGDIQGSGFNLIGSN